MANDKIKMAVQMILSNNAQEMATKIAQVIDESAPKESVELNDLVNQVKALLTQLEEKAASIGFTEIKP